MKKILIALAGLALVSCAKVNDLASVTFSSGEIESNTMTRASRVDTVRQMVASRMPTQMDVTLTSTKVPATYKVALGESITVPVGEYNVRAVAQCPATLTMRETPARFSASPDLEALEKVTLTSGENHKVLKPHFTGFGIVVDNREVEKLTVSSYMVPETDVPMEFDGHYGITFVNGLIRQKFIFKVYPVDKINEDVRSVSFTHDASYGGKVIAKPGMYYVIHPDEIEKVGAGFDIEFPTMDESDVL